MNRMLIDSGSPFEDQIGYSRAVVGGYFGHVRPAAMMISADLSDPRMKIEIEVTARKQRHSHCAGQGSGNARASNKLGVDL